jgi:hypothetical protein
MPHFTPHIFAARIKIPPVKKEKPSKIESFSDDRTYFRRFSRKNFILGRQMPVQARRNERLLKL